MKIASLALLSLSLLAAAVSGCADTPSPAAQAPAAAEPETESEEELTAKKTLELVVSVDWEGRDLTEANLHAMEAFRERFPDVPLTQFVNAAYYTKIGANAADVTARINRGIRSRDERGLHVHGWKRLFEASGVTFRKTPTFWGPTHPLSNDCNQDCGHEVPISAYTVDELRKVFRFSLDTLAANGLGRAKSFRTGGWMARSNVLEALVREGILRDNSAVNQPFLKEEIGTLPLSTWLGELWPNVTDTSQPYLIDTPAGPIVEIPDNGALADYVSPTDMMRVYGACVTAKKASPKTSIAINLGFHQETAAKYLPVLIQALDLMFAQAKKDGLTLRGTTTDRLPRPAARPTP